MSIRWWTTVMMSSGVIGLLLSAPPLAPSAPVYTYVNESGTVVMTDRLENVPVRYRGEIHVIEQELPESPDSGLMLAPVPVPDASAARDAGQGATLSERLWRLLPDTIVQGLTKSQSVILIGGLVLGSIVFGTMMLTRSPALGFAMKWALLFVAGGTVYGLYFSEMGTDLSAKGHGPANPGTVLERVRVKAEEFEQIQKERARGLDRLDALREVDER